MNEADSNISWEQWRSYFAEVITGGDPGEVDAATVAAATAAELGRDAGAATAMGHAAARRFRAAKQHAPEAQTRPPSAAPPDAPAVTSSPAAAAASWPPDPRVRVGASVAAAETRPPDPRTRTDSMAVDAASWPHELAPKLFAPPARWGWQPAAQPDAVAPTTRTEFPERPGWAEPPPPDTSKLRAARSAAVSKLVRRIAFAVVLVFAFVTFQLTIEQSVGLFGSDAQDVYRVVVLVLALLLVVGVFQALAGVRRATRDIQRFEQPYQSYRAAERERHRQALEEWERAVHKQAAEENDAARLAARLASGPQWYPVAPVSEPTRVDVVGGDPRRHGWASLLVTFGTSVLAAGNRMTLLDLTGQDIGGGLARVASAGGLRTRRMRLDAAGADVDLLRGLTRPDVAEALASAVTGRGSGSDQWEERALAVDVLGRVLDCLDAPATPGRLAAGVQVLRQGTSDDRLTTDEVSRLVSMHIGDIDRGDWTIRQLRYLAGQLDVLDDIAPGYADARPLWTDEAMSLVATGGPGGDRAHLLDQTLAQLALRALDARRLAGFLVVAGADHLGATLLRSLSDHARQADVRLVLMIDQPQGDLEKALGTGGAVCIMKMYNHRDANLAAEFIGKGHKFVVSQVTRQVGKSFTDTGGDSFGAATGEGSTAGKSGTGVSDNRGHTWTGTRGWSTQDSIGSSTTSGRVYDFVVEPAEIFAMPETAFILVDNSGPGRRVVMADGNPGICLLDRIATAVPR